MEFGYYLNRAKEFKKELVDAISTFVFKENKTINFKVELDSLSNISCKGLKIVNGEVRYFGEYGKVPLDVLTIDELLAVCHILKNKLYGN